MHIESYSFGEIVINGRAYTSDLILYPERIYDSWWRLNGHLLQIEDLKDVLAENPDVLIIGTGAMGVMKVPVELQMHLQGLNIELYIEKTEEAIKIYNSLEKNKKIIAAFHLTC